MAYKEFVIFALIFFAFCSTSLCCERISKVEGFKKSENNGYRLIISDVERGYEPGKIYYVFLLANQTDQRFSQFSINALAATTFNRKTTDLSLANPKRVGRFQLFSDVFAKFDENCVNTVIEVDDEPKLEIQAMWVAPTAGSGCVAISATIFDYSQTWLEGDGNLTQIICENKIKLQFNECCACDEAKYSFTFEGIWSNETHPKDFPFAIWLTHFSDVIGASHDTNFSFWGENHIATDGFRSLAEWGSVRLLEIELRAKGPRLRTLIKAPGLWYPNVNFNTTAQFRVDRIHHKLSLASMFGPSPDWVVGVNGLNLCESDCSWKDSININLYPWDAGTDNGITYMSPNSETQPREKMVRITTMYPEDPRQPFYNPNEMEMIPLAKLYIKKEKTIRKNCDTDILVAQVLETSENEEESTNYASECNVSEYTDWTPCSVTCGKGIRMRTREYLNKKVAEKVNCNRQLVNKEMCVAALPECDAEESEDKDDNLAQSLANTDDAGEGIGICKTTKWSEWSECSVTCGIGISMKTRTFIDHLGRKKCPHISVVEKEKCMKPECTLIETELPDPMCPATMWSDWSPCSVTCGTGIQIRTRLLLVDHSLEKECKKRIELHQQQKCIFKEDCNIDEQEMKEICSMTIETGPCRGVYERYFYNKITTQCEQFIYGGCRGNKNNFLTIDECNRVCARNNTFVNNNLDDHIIETRKILTNDVINCVVSKWTNWSACSVTCGGIGFSEKYRRILTEPQNGGTLCPKRLLKRKRCVTPNC